MNTAQKAMAVAVVAILCIGAVYVVLDDDGPTTRLRTSWDLVTVDEIADMSSSEAFEELQTACDRFVEQASSGTLSPKAMGGLLDDLNDTIKETACALGLFQWDYYRDSTGLSEEYVGWSAFDSRCMDIRNTALREVLEGPGGDTLRKVIGECVCAFLNPGMIKLPQASISSSQITSCFLPVPLLSSQDITLEIFPSSIWISPLKISAPSSIVSILALYILVLIHNSYLYVFCGQVY